jgi:hypothetical protein
MIRMIAPLRVHVCLWCVERCLLKVSDNHFSVGTHDELMHVVKMPCSVCQCLKAGSDDFQRFAGARMATDGFDWTLRQGELNN